MPQRHDVLPLPRSPIRSQTYHLTDAYGVTGKRTYSCHIGVESIPNQAIAFQYVRLE